MNTGTMKYNIISHVTCHIIASGILNNADLSAKTYPIIIKSLQKLWTKLFVVITVSADGLAPLGARPSADTVMTDDTV